MKRVRVKILKANGLRAQENFKRRNAEDGEVALGTRRNAKPARGNEKDPRERAWVSLT
jgi:hypothetical protein